MTTFTINPTAAQAAAINAQPRCTPEQSEVVLGHLRSRQGICSPSELARTLGLRTAAARKVLDELCEQGLIRRLQRGTRHLIERVDLDVRPALVKNALRAPLLQLIQQRRELVGCAARQLGEDDDFVLETAKVLAQEGQLRLVPLGATFLLEHTSTLVVWRDPHVPLPQSEGARFQAELHRLRKLHEKHLRLAAKASRPSPPRSPVNSPAQPGQELTLPGPTSGTAKLTSIAQPQPQESCAPTTSPGPVQGRTPQVVTLELEWRLKFELPLHLRRQPGHTARVAEQYGLSVRQVRRALARQALPDTAPSPSTA